jgi:hypothetical protein
MSVNPPTPITERFRASGVYAGIGLDGGIIPRQALAAFEELRPPRPKTAVVSVAEVEVCVTFLTFLAVVGFAPGIGVIGVIRSVPGHFFVLWWCLEVRGLDICELCDHVEAQDMLAGWVSGLFYMIMARDSG